MKQTKKYSMKYYVKMLGQDYSNSMLRYLPDIEKYRLQTGELPFEYTGDMEYWDYYYFTEYSKRFGVHNSQFLTPPETAKKMVEILEDYDIFNYSVFEPCCGSGMITREIEKRYFQRTKSFDIDPKLVEFCRLNIRTGAIVEYDFTYKDNIFENMKFFYLISNPPYEKLFEFFQYIDKHLALGAISVLLLPVNTFQKRQNKEFQSIIDRYSIIEIVPNPYPFVNTEIQTSIFVLRKER